jgi:hypothetical protein
MANRIFGLDSVLKKFPMIATEARKISTALAAQEAGSCLQGGFLTYAFACHNIIAKSASLRAANTDLDAELKGWPEGSRLPMRRSLLLNFSRLFGKTM